MSVAPPRYDIFGQLLAPGKRAGMGFVRCNTYNTADGKPYVPDGWARQPASGFGTRVALHSARAARCTTRCTACGCVHVCARVCTCVMMPPFGLTCVRVHACVRDTFRAPAHVCGP